MPDFAGAGSSPDEFVRASLDRLARYGPQALVLAMCKNAHTRPYIVHLATLEEHGLQQEACPVCGAGIVVIFDSRVEAVLDQLEGHAEDYDEEGEEDSAGGAEETS